MKLATTTCDFGIYPSHEERIRHLYDAGFRYIDLSLYTESDMKEFLEPGWEDRALRLKEYAQALGMTFVQAHSPGGNPLSRDAKWDGLLEATIRSVEICGILGIPNTVVHAGWAGGIGREEYYEQNRDFYALLYPAMEKNNVNVLIENSAKSNMGSNYYFLDGADMKEFLKYAGHPLLHACWDTGHANIEGHQYDDIVALGDDLRALHINDNRGKMDEHMMPYLGTMCMDEVMLGLREIGYRGCFTFEGGSTPVRRASWPLSRTPFRETPHLQDPPDFLYDELERAMYRIGEYILKTYDCFEE